MFPSILSSSGESIESESKLAKSQRASSLVVANDSDWFKSPRGTIFFLRVGPLPSGYGGGGGGGYQKVALNRLKIEQQVA